MSAFTFNKGAQLMMRYVASKGAAVGITRVAARELGDFGITVNSPVVDGCGVML